MFDQIHGFGKVPLIGKVGKRTVVETIGDNAFGQGLTQVRCRTGLDPHRTVRVEVEGESMLPFDRG